MIYCLGGEKKMKTFDIFLSEPMEQVLDKLFNKLDIKKTSENKETFITAVVFRLMLVFCYRPMDFAMEYGKNAIRFSTKSKPSVISITIGEDLYNQMDEEFEKAKQRQSIGITKLNKENDSITVLNYALNCELKSIAAGKGSIQSQYILDNIDDKQEETLNLYTHFRKKQCLTLKKVVDDLTNSSEIFRLKKEIDKKYGVNLSYLLYYGILSKQIKIETEDIKTLTIYGETKSSINQSKVKAKLDKLVNDPDYAKKIVNSLIEWIQKFIKMTDERIRERNNIDLVLEYIRSHEKDENFKQLWNGISLYYYARKIPAFQERSKDDEKDEVYQNFYKPIIKILEDINNGTLSIKEAKTKCLERLREFENIQKTKKVRK